MTRRSIIPPRTRILRFVVSLHAVLLALGARCAAAAEPAPAAPVPEGRTISQYALVSANDFPQRDPTDWRLLGSNDDGRTWKLLDIRTNELFQSRHLRRAFPVADPGPFTTYRLEIDRFLDGEAANCVQLAEIELMGVSEDDLHPVPAFNDVVGAQAENPPIETAAKLFDGRVETKWLARPARNAPLTSWIQWSYRPFAGIVVTNVSGLLALRARAAEGFAVSLDAAVVRPGSAASPPLLLDSTGVVELHGSALAEGFRCGQRVRIEGVSRWSEGRVGIARETITRVGPEPPAAPERVDIAQPFPDGDTLKWAEIEGRVRFRRVLDEALSVELERDGQGMWVHFPPAMSAKSLPEPGSIVTVTGLCRAALSADARWVAADLWMADTGVVKQADSRMLPRQGTGSPAAADPGGGPEATTSIGRIRAMTRNELAERPRVRVRGVVTDLLGTFIQDDTAGIHVNLSSGESRKITELGLFVDLEGRAGLGEFGEPVVSVAKITMLGRGKLPEPQRLNYAQLASFHHDGQWVELEGVVRATDGAHLLMICHGREVTASIGSGSTALVNGLVDASVRVRGVGVTALDDQGRVQGVHLVVSGLDQIDVLEAPREPFSLPVEPVGNLLKFNGPRQSFHRVLVEGVLTLEDDRRLFLQDDTGSAMAIFQQDIVLDARLGRSRWLFFQVETKRSRSRPRPRFTPGDRIQVVGFPETRGYSPMLTEVLVRKVGGPEPLEPVKADVAGMTDGRLDSKLVNLVGTVRAATTLEARRTISLEWTDRIIDVVVPETIDLPAISIGTKLRVTGVCQADPLPYAELGQRVGAIRILARGPRDLLVLERPPWLTVQRALLVIGGMAFVMAAALVWIKQLRRQVEERTAQLSTAIHLREQTERQHALEQERSRIAQDLHDDLGANLTQIVFLSQRVENTSTDAAEMSRWFRLIPATARRTIQSLDEIVWAINPKHDSLESFANYLVQFAHEHTSLAGLRCILDVPTVLPAMHLGIEVRHSLVLAAREALQNVVTHSGATTVQVGLRLADDGLTVEISDNGSGFDEAAVSSDSNGLANMRRRLDELGGRMELSARPGGGTTIRFFVPVPRPHPLDADGKNGAGPS
jgi:signal transduction histidine kinase